MSLTADLIGRFLAAEDHAVGLSILCLTFLNCLCKVCCNSTFICACENIARRLCGERVRLMRL